MVQFISSFWKGFKKPFEVIGDTVYNSPIVGDGLHMIDDMFVGGRRITETVRDTAPKVIKSVSRGVEEVADAVPEIIDTAENVVEDVGGFLKSPFLLPALAVGAFLILKE